VKNKVNIILDVDDWRILELSTLLTEFKRFFESKNIDLNIQFFTYKEINLSSD
jgi:hypothetical protein